MRGLEMKRKARAIEERRERPRYSVAEAARYLGIPAATLYSWLPSHGGPLEHINVDDARLSFFDLVEAHILRAARDRKVPKARILRGLEYLKKKCPGVTRPLVTSDFFTLGKDLLVEGMLGEQDKVLVNASREGQLELKDTILEHLRLISRDSFGLPERLYPKNGSHIVSITFDILSGKPVVDGTRISTQTIAQRRRAGESVQELAEEYRLGKNQIEAALNYEEAA
jgi:uncharacterized protein (DUF433 family)